MSRLLMTAAVSVAFATPAHATVIMSEIAWMGTKTSANDEWIELFNSGPEAVDVTGWTISDSSNLEIVLAGTIESGQYAVLERTNDDSAPGDAFLIYTGALKNTGATLTLRDVFGTTVDAVSGGTNWQQIGGDNDAKYTAQRTETGWVTAPATPGSGQLATAALPEPVPAPAATTAEAQEKPVESSTFSFATPTEDIESTNEAKVENGVKQPATPAPAPEAAVAAVPLQHSSWPYAGLVVLLSVGIVGVLFGRSGND